MAVVKSKRVQGKLTVYTRANELAVFTITICSKAHANKGNSYNLTRSMEKYYTNLWKEQEP